MTDPTVNETNKRIADLFGRDTISGIPKFRVVWSSDQTEFRRVGEGVNSSMQLMPKYSYKPGRWVLEKWMEGGHADLASPVNYEPIWFFEDKAGNYLFPVERAVIVLIQCLLNPVKLTPSQVLDADAKQFEAEVAYFYDYFDNERPYLASKLEAGEAVTVGDVSKCIP